MDQNTTNINDLPIENNPPENRDLPEKDLNQNLTRMMEQPQSQKKVSFDKIPVVIEKTKLQEIKEPHKIIILATLFFLLFSDLKIKSYILNILIVMLGSSLKSSSGGISKIGLVLYSIIYGISLFILVSMVDLATKHLS